jgi:hypothetical protein
MEAAMPAAHDDFYLKYGGEIREALIMLEGDDGAFELLAHGRDGDKDRGRPWALVRSTGSDRRHLLVHDPTEDLHRPCCWRPIGQPPPPAVEDHAARLQHDTQAPEAALAITT